MNPVGPGESPYETRVDYEGEVQAPTKTPTPIDEAPAPQAAKKEPEEPKPPRPDPQPQPRATPPQRRPGPDANREPVVGSILKNRYRLEECIGRGGMGTVFRATDLEVKHTDDTASNVAIKVLKPELRNRKQALIDEVEKTRTMQQENIVDVYGYESDDAGGFMVMEYLTGIRLDQFVLRDWADGMPFALAWPYIKAMGAALTYVHRRGGIHSDFKPSNVLVIAASAKVLDFGIARVARSGGEITARGEKPIGLTPEFASCEMLERKDADKRDDVFCFGLVVYFLLSGRHPFDGKWADQARDEKMTVPPIRALSKRQRAALKHALAFDRFERAPSISEVLQGLDARTPPPWGLWAALGSAVIAAGVLGYLYVRPTPDSPDQFLANLCRNGSDSPANSPADSETAAVLIQQGGAYLRSGENPFNPGVLSENVSSALGAFQAALPLGSAHCAEAARGVLGVATAYKNEARRLYAAHDYPRAEQMAQIALRIWPDSGETQTLLYKIMARSPPPTAVQR